jgi:hypothetical protein
MYSKFRHLAWLVFFSLFLTAPAFAQFEVSPDHFDAAPQKAAPKVKQPNVQHPKTVHKATATKRPASGVGAPKKRLAQKKSPGQTVSAQNKASL